MPKAKDQKERWHIPEFDLDFNCPLVEILVLVNANLASAADLLKIVGKGIIDPPDDAVESRLPHFPQLLDLIIQLLQIRPLGNVLGLQSLDISGTLLKIS